MATAKLWIFISLRLMLTMDPFRVSTSPSKNTGYNTNHAPLPLRLFPPIGASWSTTINLPTGQLLRMNSAASSDNRAFHESSAPPRPASEPIKQIQLKVAGSATIMPEGAPTQHVIATPAPARLPNIRSPATRVHDWRARILELQEENRLMQRGIDIHGKGGKFATRQVDRNASKIEIYEGKIKALVTEITAGAKESKAG